MEAIRNLSREQSIAIQKYKENRDRFYRALDHPFLCKKKQPLLDTDFIAASRQPFKKSKLPREDGWCWNQSNAKATVIVDGELIDFRKISPRKKTKSAKAPFFKIWLYHSVHNDFHFLWCEKGEDKAGINTEIGRIFPHQIELNNLAFLKPFIDEQIALELNWL